MITDAIISAGSLAVRGLLSIFPNWSLSWISSISSAFTWAVGLTYYWDFVLPVGLMWTMFGIVLSFESVMFGLRFGLWLANFFPFIKNSHKLDDISR